MTTRYTDLLKIQNAALLLATELGCRQYITPDESKLARIADFLIDEIEHRFAGTELTHSRYERARAHQILALVLRTRHFKAQLAKRKAGQQPTDTDVRTTRTLGAAQRILLDVIDRYGDELHPGDEIGNGLEDRLQREFGMSRYEAEGDAAFARLLLIPIRSVEEEAVYAL